MLIIEIKFTIIGAFPLPSFNILPLKCREIDLDKTFEYFSLCFNTSMAIICIIYQEASKVLSWYKKSIRFMERIFDTNTFSKRVIDNNLIQASSLLSLPIKYLTTKNIIKFFRVIKSLKSISTCYSLLIRS